MSLAYGTTNTTIAVTPTNPYTIVMIDKTDSTYTNVISMGTDIQKPSTSKDVSLDNGPNYFRIKLKSEIGNNEREVHLKITVEKQTGFFATDGTVINWDTLVNTYGLANDLINGTSVLNTINKQGKLVLPNSVTRIESSSFKNCTKLTEIDISSSVTAIGIDAFRGCTNLTRIEIPDNVTSIENAAFRECTNLTSIVLPNNLSSISSGLFFGDNKLNSVIIPNSVTTIGEDAFRNCTGLTSINLPNSITTISKDAFQQSGLVSLTIPRSVTRIERFACLYCNSLTSVVFEDKNNWTHNGQTIDVSNSSTNANKFKNDGYTYPLIKTN